MTMYMVGVNVLSAFWEKHREAEGELRALHALLSVTGCAALPAALGKIAMFDESGAEIALRSAKVRIEVSAAAGVGRYAAVVPVKEEER